MCCSCSGRRISSAARAGSSPAPSSGSPRRSTVMKRRPGEVGLYLRSAIRLGLLRRSRSFRRGGSARWPSSSPACGPGYPRRLGLDVTLAMFTRRTWTPNSSSTAWRTWSRVRVLVDLERVPVLVDLVVALLRRRPERARTWRMSNEAITSALPSSCCSAVSVASTERAQTSSADRSPPT